MTGAVVGRPAITRTRLDPCAAAAMVVLCASWAVQQAAVKIAIEGGLPPLWQAGLRSAGAALLLFGWAVSRGDRSLWRLHDGTLGPGLIVAFLFAIEVALYFVGLAHTTAARGVLFLYTAPFVVALGAHWFVPGEQLRLTDIAGLLVAFSGVAAAVAGGLAAPAGHRTITGDMLVLAAAFLWGATTVLIKATALARASAAKVTLYQLAGSAPVLLVLALLAASPSTHPTEAAWLALLYQTVGVAFVSYLAWFALIARYPAGKLSVFTCLTPPLGALAGATLLGERISPSFAASIALVTAGIWIANRKG